MNLKKLLFSIVFFTTTLHAQLADFSLQVTKTEETCLGNGSLTFTASNLTPLSTLLYKVYRLPDTTNPISILATGNHLSSLSAGTYRVVAIQALGSNSNTKQQDVTINSNIMPFSINVTSSNQNCSAGGAIIVNATSGVPASYEIIAGPVTRPLQPSNTFSNLPSGTYNIRAFDICGMGKVKTFTLSVVNSSLAISDATYSNTGVVCDSMTVSNTISATSGTIGYPIAVRHTLNPMTMGGQSIVIDQVFATGSPESLEVSAVMPRYMSEIYTYDLKVTDNCTTVYEKTENIVDPNIKLTLGQGEAPCGEKFLIVTPSMHKAPYTVNIISAPAGFNAADFNTSPQPFGDSSVNYGDPENPVPFGTYVVEITDACGRVATESITIEFVMPTPVARGTNNGCFSEFGKIRVSVPQNKLISATIIAAPAAYMATQTLPKNVTASINSSGTLSLNNMPLGTYTIIYTDNCGNQFQTDVEVPPFVEKPFNIAALPDCTPGFGTIRLRSGNGNLTSAIIIGAPATYSANHALPYNVTSVINGGDLYMNSLPEGNYIFRAVDQCGITHDMAIDVQGYRAPQNSFTFTPSCGSFSVKVTDSSNGTEGASFYLQKLNTVTGKWGHPSNGGVYSEGSDPTSATGVKLTNNALRSNLNYSGKFRIVKRFESFNNGSEDNTVCVSVLGEFNYTDGLSISNAYSLACIGEPNTVYIEALGYPTAYRIIKKNGASFVVQNGTSNVFANLVPADYVFQVEDACGNVVTKPVSVQMLPSITEASQPTDMVACAEENATSEVFHLPGQNASVLGSLPAAMYTITYHLTQADADNGVNALPEYYTNTSNGQTIYARLVHNEISLCHGTTSFRLFLGQYPEPVITTVGTICDNNSITLTANAGFSSYLWSNGATTRTITVTEPGVYTVIVQKAYGDQYCEAFTETTIKASSTPRIVKIDTDDWTTHNNSITVYAEGADEYLYSIDGINFQESNVFTGLDAGQYNVYVKDGLHCGYTSKEVALLHYPNFFTPNGDGHNDKWQIKYSILEPHLKVSIFDRYGKLITSFGSTSEGWDGDLNGARLPATDYWFVVTREDGREYKGHFAMMR